MPDCQVFIAGALGGTNVGESLYEGARSAGIRAELIDTGQLMDASWLHSKIAWRLCGRRPPRLARFSARAVEQARRLHPTMFLSVGIATMQQQAVRSIRELGVITMTYLTDDPWNPVHQSRWSMRAIREYDVAVTPRRANLEDLKELGCRSVYYMPFGYDPRFFFPGPVDSILASDVLFVGGADSDRVPWIAALLQAGHRVALYGSYWDRFSATRGRSRGQAGPEVIRRATSSTKVALCLVRRANRDGHVMRSLEVPAVGACMLTEDSPEHRALFGEDGECVLYFSTPEQMIERLTWLLANEPERERLARAAHVRITTHKHTYGDRVQELLSLASGRPR
jgi:spore maturation protein CgeB